MHSIFLLQLKQASRAHAAFIVLCNVLYFVKIKLYYTALAFGIRICLTFNALAAAFAVYKLMFDHL